MGDPYAHCPLYVRATRSQDSSTTVARRYTVTILPRIIPDRSATGRPKSRRSLCRARQMEVASSGQRQGRRLLHPTIQQHALLDLIRNLSWVLILHMQTYTKRIHIFY